MATASAAQSKVAQAAQSDAVVVNPPNRREFLYYIWGASIALLLGQSSAALIWFSLPRFKEGEFGGTFNFSGDRLPAPNSPPVNIPEGRFWLSNTEADGFIALYGVCTHLGCLPKWVDTNFRFECPCHGSKYELDGKFIEGPAPRSLDRFRAVLTFNDGSTLETVEDQGITLPEGKEVVNIAVDTGRRIQRPGRV